MMLLFLYHLFPVAADEESRTDAPSQKLVGPAAVSCGVAGGELTVTEMGFDCEVQPPRLDVTVKLPLTVTVIAGPVTPFSAILFWNHCNEPAALVERIRLPPVQKDSGPPAVTTGTGGVGFTVTLTGDEVDVHPPAPVTRTA